MRSTLLLSISFWVQLSFLLAQESNKKVDSLFILAQADSSITGKIGYLLQAESLSENCLPCKAQCHAELGVLYCQNKYYKIGYSHLKTAINLRRILGDSLRVAGNYSNIAIYKLEEGLHAQAITHGLYALKILEALHRIKNGNSIKDTLTATSQANLYNILSNIHSKFDNPQLGLQFALKCKKLYGDIGDTLSMKDADFTLANRYFSLFQEKQNLIYADSATLLYQLCRQFFEENPEDYPQSDLGHIHHNLASLAISKHDIPGAWKEIKRAQLAYQEDEDFSGLVDVEILKANALIDADRNYASALSCMRTARTYIQHTAVDTTVHLEIYTLLSECFEALHQPDSALIYSRMAEKLYLQLFTSQQKRFNEIDRANLEKRNQLESELSQQQIAEGKARQRQWESLAAILALLISLGALIWRQREQKQKIRITRQNQEIEDTLKDARATRMELSIEADAASIFITYHDNGIGFDYEAMLARNKSLGLQSIVEKTLELGGNTPEIIAAPGHGITISIEIPTLKPELP